MSKFIASVSLLVMSVSLSILALIHGWGLEPVSWSWIIWCAVGHVILLGISTVMSKEE